MPFVFFISKKTHNISCIIIRYLQQFPIAEMALHLDWINLMTYVRDILYFLLRAVSSCASIS